MKIQEEKEKVLWVFERNGNLQKNTASSQLACYRLRTNFCIRNCHYAVVQRVTPPLTRSDITPAPGRKDE